MGWLPVQALLPVSTGLGWHGEAGGSRALLALAVLLPLSQSTVAVPASPGLVWLEMKGLGVISSG